jgi:hypothetical protein
MVCSPSDNSRGGGGAVFEEILRRLSVGGTSRRVKASIIAEVKCLQLVSKMLSRNGIPLAFALNPPNNVTDCAEEVSLSCKI